MKNKLGYEKVLGKTIKGGDYSEIYYYNNDNEACKMSEATHCIIYERKSNGTLVHTIYAMM